MEPFWGSSRARLRTNFRSQAIFSGQLSLRLLHWSSLNTTSKTQCTLFSIAPEGSDADGAGCGRTDDTERAVRIADGAPPFSCESGVCGACRARLGDSSVHLRRRMALADAEVARGLVLTFPRPLP